MRKVTEVLWSDGARTPLREAMAYGDASGAWPKKVLWADGGFSWAKGWRFQGLKMQRIGIGAYGDCTLVSRDAAGSLTYHPDFA